jgi:hypothetical protein
MTDEQFAMALEFEDLTEEEKALARQQSMANQLRGSALQPSSGRDFGSQLARAAQGALAAYGQTQADKRSAGLSATRKSKVGDIRDYYMKRGKYTPMVDEMVPGQFSVEDPRYG